MANLQEFYSSFQVWRSTITTRLDALDQSKASPEQIAQIAQDIQAERKKLNEATSFLPAYDRRSYDSQLKQLESRIASLRSRNALAKGGFAFKKAASTASPSPKPAEISPQMPSDMRPETADAESISRESATSSVPNLQITSTSYKCPTERFLRDKSSLSATDLTINSLDHCIVDLLAPNSSEPGDRADEALQLTAVHLRDVKDSVVLLGHVQGSILAYNLERCIVVAACHQLRVHASKSACFYLHVASNAIIEDSSSLNFAPYPESLPLPADVRHQRSTHDAIQDFSHVKSAPSPNWSVMSQTIEEGTWDEIRRFATRYQTIPEEDRKASLEAILARIVPNSP